jgi:hypothetical protein
MELNII